MGDIVNAAISHLWTLMEAIFSVFTSFLRCIKAFLSHSSG